MTNVTQAVEAVNIERRIRWATSPASHRRCGILDNIVSLGVSWQEVSDPNIQEFRLDCPDRCDSEGGLEAMQDGAALCAPSFLHHRTVPRPGLPYSDKKGSLNIF